MPTVGLLTRPLETECRQRIAIAQTRGAGGLGSKKVYTSDHKTSLLILLSRHSPYPLQRQVRTDVGVESLVIVNELLN
jgi:hypothetical protein